MLKLLVILGISTTLSLAHASLRVVTTTSTLSSLTKEIGKDKIEVLSIAKGSQDPHYVEAKPSYMVRLRNADLVISVGLELEIGWLENVLRGARNPRLLIGKTGHLVAGDHITPMEVPTIVDRSHGDIHSEGNPHFLLDPFRTIEVTKAIMFRLSKLDSPNAPFYQKNWVKFSQDLRAKRAIWKKRIQATKIKKIITHHRTLSYFLDHFDIKLWDTIEPKPGIPPSARHIISLIKEIKNLKKGCILVESFFETGAAHRIAKSSPAIVQVVPTEVGSLPHIENYSDMIEKIVSSIENCAKP